MGKAVPKKPGPKAKPKAEAVTVPTPEKGWYSQFLDVLCKTANVSQACRDANISRQAAYDRRNDDEQFAKAWDDALDVATDALEAEARRRAIDGVDEPAGWYQGVAGGTVRKYSDTLLIFLLKGAKPEKYRERFDVEASGKGGKPIEHVHFYIPSNGRES